VAGDTGSTNSGSGGGGAASTGISIQGGGGGGAGEYVELYISNPSTTYTYTIGSGGSGGSAGTAAGGAVARGLSLSRNSIDRLVETNKNLRGAEIAPLSLFQRWPTLGICRKLHLPRHTIQKRQSQKKARSET
jgi:hypothetical protein